MNNFSAPSLHEPWPILTIDPGPTQSAFTVWDRSNDCLIECGQEKNDFMLERLDARWDSGAVWNEVVIEGVYFYGMILNKAAFGTLEWIGRFTQKTKDHWNSIQLDEGHYQDVPVYQVYYPDVAYHLCGSRSKVTQANINAVLSDRYGGKGTKKDPGMLYNVKEHIWSAVHVAAYWTDKHHELTLKLIPA